MATYFGTTINDSPTAIFPVAEKIANAQGIAVTLTENGVKLPEAGGAVFGVIPISENESYEAGEEVTVQIKDIGAWIAGGAIKIGEELAADAEGKAKKAEDGQFIVGIALSAAAEAGTRIRFQMTKYGSKKN